MSATLSAISLPSTYDWAAPIGSFERGAVCDSRTHALELGTFPKQRSQYVSLGIGSLIVVLLFGVHWRHGHEVAVLKDHGAVGRQFRRCDVHRFPDQLKNVSIANLIEENPTRGGEKQVVILVRSDSLLHL